jgi:PAS domain S-box-containing protein
MTVTKLVDDAGRPIGIASTERDISARKRAAEKLRETTNYLQNLIDHANAPIIVWDLQLCITRFNCAFESLTGRRADEVIGKSLEILFPPALAESSMALIKKTTGGERWETVEISILHLDGSVRSVLWNSATVFATDGKTPVAAIAQGQDITERKQAQAALALQTRIANIFLTLPDDEMFNEVLKVVLDVMRSPFGVFGFIDEDGANVVPTMTRQIWDKCQVPDKTFVFPRATWGNSSWPRAIREKKANYSNEVSAKVPEGHVNVTRHISVPILFQGEVIGLLQVANKETDYTEADIGTLEAIAGQVAPLLQARLLRDRAGAELVIANKELLFQNEEKEKRAAELVIANKELLFQNEEKEKRAAELARSNSELARFLYTASHDLKSPVVTARTFLGYLEQDMAAGDAGRIAKDVNFIRAATDRMVQLLDDVLEMSRIGRVVGAPVNVTFRALVDTALAAVAGRIAERGVTVQVDDREMTLHGDRVRLEEIWQNLVENACKFMGDQPAPRLEIGVETRDAEPVFFVRDNGIGIDPRFQAKVFGLFESSIRRRKGPALA